MIRYYVLVLTVIFFAGRMYSTHFLGFTWLLLVTLGIVEILNSQGVWSQISASVVLAGEGLDSFDFNKICFFFNFFFFFCIVLFYCLLVLCCVFSSVTKLFFLCVFVCVILVDNRVSTQTIPRPY